MTKTLRNILLGGMGALLAACLSLGAAGIAPAFTARAAESDHTDHADGWTQLTEAGGSLAGGNYYLEGDVQLESDLTVSGTVTLCLNGHKLTGTGTGPVITVDSGADFTLCDCQSESTAAEHRHAYFVDYDGLYVFDDTLTAETADGFIAGGVVTGGNMDYGGGIEVFGDLTIAGGTIAGNYAADFGGGIDMLNGDLTIAGGMIAGNYATDGGGIYFADGTFEMTDGSIANNSAIYGGGMEVWRSDVVISGGSIAGNTSEESGGGIYIEDSTFEMMDGSIVNNATDYFGGGVYFRKNTVKMTGGSVTDNSAEYGGGIYIEHAKMVMNGGTISGNEVLSGVGGGVYAIESSEITLTAGTISGNIAESDGGGIYSSDSTLNMSGGEVIGNKSGDTNGGGGIFVNSGSTLNLSGGQIVDNFTLGKNGGGGIYAQSEEAIINLSGAPVVAGNMFNEQENNLFLRADSGAKANIVGPLTYGAKIGVTLYYYEDGVRDSVTGEFLSGYSDHNSADPSEYFFADNAKFAVGLGANGEVEVVQAIYTVVYVDGGEENSVTYDIGAEMALESVDAEAGFVGGWTLTEGASSIDYAGGQTFAGGIGKAHGDVITLYAVRVRDVAGDIDGIVEDLTGIRAELDAAVEAVEGNAADIADLAAQLQAAQDAVAALDETYATDEELAAAVADLEEAIGSARTALQTAIDGVQAELDAAVEDLQAAIDGSAADLSAQLAALQEAYEAADALLAADIDALQGADDDLAARIDALESAHTAADDAIRAAVEQLQAAVDDNEASIGTLTALLWVFAAVSLVALGVGGAGLAFALKNRKD